MPLARAPRLPPDSGDAIRQRRGRLSLSDDGRSLYARFEGTLEVAGALLEFARDRATGRLEPSPAPRGCLSPFAGPDCTGLSVLHTLLVGFGLASDTAGYVASADFPGDDGIVALQRGPATGALAPLDAPGACWGTVTDYSQESLPLTTGERCAAAPEQRQATLFSEPLVTADGRNAYVWSQAEQDFFDAR